MALQRIYLPFRKISFSSFSFWTFTPLMECHYYGFERETRLLKIFPSLLVLVFLYLFKCTSLFLCALLIFVNNLLEMLSSETGEMVGGEKADDESLSDISKSCESYHIITYWCIFHSHSLIHSKWQKSQPNIGEACCMICECIIKITISRLELPFFTYLFLSRSAMRMMMMMILRQSGWKECRRRRRRWRRKKGCKRKISSQLFSWPLTKLLSTYDIVRMNPGARHDSRYPLQWYEAREKEKKKASNAVLSKYEYKYNIECEILSSLSNIYSRLLSACMWSSDYRNIFF